MAKCYHCGKNLAGKFILEQAARTMGKRSRRELVPDDARRAASLRGGPSAEDQADEGVWNAEKGAGGTWREKKAGAGPSGPGNRGRNLQNGTITSAPGARFHVSGPGHLTS